MKIYEGLDAAKHLVYFEVSNAMFSRHAACKLVSRVPGVSLTSQPALLLGRKDIFCTFTLDGKHFELWEPYGDNSRFHIAAKPLEHCAALQQLRATFHEHRPVSGITRLLLLATGIALVCFRLYSRQ